MGRSVLRLLILLLPSFLFAGTFTHAINNYHNSAVSFKDYQGVNTTSGVLLFSEKPFEKGLCSKESLQLGVCLLKKSASNSSIKKLPLKVLSRYPKNVVALSGKSVVSLSVTRESLGIQDLAKLNQSVKTGSVVLGSCGTLRGFTTNDHLLTSDLINYFLYKKPQFSSVGAHFSQTKQGIVVTTVNPFFSYGRFKVGDKVLYHNGKKYGIKQLLDTIMRYKPGTKIYFKVLRAGQKVPIQIITKPLLGGGVLAETYLEQYGLRFNKMLHIVKIDSAGANNLKHLLLGDRLVAINGIAVKDEEDIEHFFSSFKPNKMQLTLLFERHGLQFFIHIPANKMLTL